MPRPTPKMRAICDFDMPFSSRFRMRRLFLLNFSFFDSAVNGRPSFLPCALRFAKLDLVRSEISSLSISSAKKRRLKFYFVCHCQGDNFLLMSGSDNFYSNNKINRFFAFFLFFVKSLFKLYLHRYLSVFKHQKSSKNVRNLYGRFKR